MIETKLMQTAPPGDLFRDRTVRQEARARFVSQEVLIGLGPAETLQIQASAEAHPVLQRRGGTFVRFRR